MSKKTKNSLKSIITGTIIITAIFALIITGQKIAEMEIEETVMEMNTCAKIAKEDYQINESKCEMINNVKCICKEIIRKEKSYKLGKETTFIINN